MNYEEAKAVLVKAFNNDEIKKAERKGALISVIIIDALVLIAGAIVSSGITSDDFMIFLLPMVIIALLFPATIWNYNYKKRKINNGTFFEEANKSAVIKSAIYYSEKYPQYF